MLMWWPQSHQPLIDQVAAQYLWTDDAIPATMPTLNDVQVEYLVTKGTRWLVLLGDDGREFGPAMEQLRARGFTATTWREQDLRSGSASIRVRVVELTGLPVTVRSSKADTTGD
jgi:hypothetical protein